MFSLDLGDGLRLTLAEERHAEPITDLMARNQARLALWQPWAAYRPTVESTRSYIRGGLDRFAEGRELYLMIEHVGVPVGACGMRRDPQTLIADVGYWLDAGAEGKGLVTRAVTALTEAAFTAYGMRRVEIRTMVGNKRARAVAERCGYEFEGVLRRAMRFADRNEDVALYSAVS
ncbi:ribosomal-protein-serine acetyltransferase [Catenuloplanes nepalensis]|uniref:Ribosomal-protein-serine acetyltransferase n=1 Tax=Catenuloplanes nepalensis TaxID=587533 RepID=A0ABT9MZT4_9ACTN|nr:GNAT family protein [Catenuloplanes nepalensis]MDP9796758.1 ribosomal-protein-serine acetyltransferase [Catenuloplanes nepalensis]